ncbi:DUF2793 domain-containing protein [Alphaproteobacteria bacterium KMM 3653]|uniref:DUF2793 domain-containing protein n=1 Tax=Harenicola maris TaxID=2841044 RepID=A0AAP2CNF2_9RHOB|nr:DUF2793 domain-containing protein [Harenicola maris]
MTNTPNLGLPLLQSAQAQKHVTMNEALQRMDSLCHLTLSSVTLLAPPVGAAEGSAYGVPLGATGLWSGFEGMVAIAANGGWDFVTPQPGWQAFIADTGKPAIYSGSAWNDSLLARSPSGAAMRAEIIEFDHTVAAGASDSTAITIPAGAMVCAVGARVITALSGTLTSWDLGVTGSTGQFGTGLGIGQGSYAEGILGTPTSYYSDTPLTLTAQGGDFAAGTLRFAIHHFRFDLPGA